MNPAVVVVEADEEIERESQKEREPNDAPARAQKLELGATLVGTLQSSSSAADRDWFRFALKQRRVVRLQTSGAATVDLRLVLADARGQALLRVNNAGVGGGETIANALLEPADYLVMISAVTPVKGEGPEGRRYRLRLTTRRVERNEEAEPNGDAEQASVLRWDGEVAGYCGWRRDVDWYRVELPRQLEGQLLRFELDGVDGVRPRLDIRLDNETGLQHAARVRGEGIVLTNVRPPKSGAEVVQVVVHCGKGYNFDARYALRVSAGAAEGMESEPNDTVEQAVPLSAGAKVRGILADRSDRDLYRPEIAAGTLVRIAVHPPPGLDVALALIDGAGEVRQEVDEQRAGGVELLVPHVWTSGSFIRLRAPRASSVDPLAPYALSLEELPGRDWEREPNDLPLRATVWRDSPALIRAFLQPKTDVDYYRLVPAAPTVRIALVAPSGGQLVLDLLEQEQTVVDSIALGPGVRRGLLEADVTVGGTYLLRVHSAEEEEGPAVPYQLERIALAPVGPSPVGEAGGSEIVVDEQ